MNAFSQAAIEQLGYYVYFLQNPRDSRIFYLGKGVRNRIFDHLNGIVDKSARSEKIDTIRDIRENDLEVGHYIVRHGLNEETAFELEAALIDFMDIKSLTNIQSGHRSSDFGIKTVGEISAMYDASELETNEPLMLINLNKKYDRRMSPDDLYEATRSSWCVGPRREKAKYAVATYRGLTREVYKIGNWHQTSKASGTKSRWAFEGTVVGKEIRDLLTPKSIRQYFKKGASNPIRYVNC
jgi:hypothetical protein